MKLLIKVILIGSGLVATLLVIVVGSEFYYQHRDRKFYNITIPSDIPFNKPIGHLTFAQLDSLKNLKVLEEKLEIQGDGYSGYEFYVWHRPITAGSIYIKAYEYTTGERLSDWKLSNRTRHTIGSVSDKYKLYTSKTVIDEGTFYKYYPVKFEVWFDPGNGTHETQLLSKLYIIDGWDR